MEENYTRVQKGFRILQPLLADYVAQEMRREYKEDWWRNALAALGDQARDLPSEGDYATLVNSLDMANCLRLFDRKWNELFRRKLSIDYRTWSKELMGVRHKLAHLGGGDFSEDNTWRALDTMARLCEAFDDEAAEEIRKMLREARYGSADGSTKVVDAAPAAAAAAANKKTGGILTSAMQGLPSWRDIIVPHPDVAQGRYKKAEFAADLAQVARGEGSFEYRDPVEFFARTYVTEGMTGLLVQALKRVAGGDGEPVIQLKTAFGGGKTHSILALYHLMRGRVSVDKLPNIKPVLAQAGVATLPKANVAVLVGTALDPTKARRPKNFQGITINTLWGEMAAQLAESAGNPALYDYVKEADKKGVSPGSKTLKDLFDAAAPCLVLMDELVAYAKKLYGVPGLPAGSFDNLITFIQEITEAARASKNSLVVASIPESDIEIGGEAGKKALETIEHTFGRMESIWKPVAANEGFEVVRRRLFLDCKNPEGRDSVCTKFSQMYLENPGDFPLESREAGYRDRMISCYPIHPEVFDRLYEDWATLERFQRTRGVLRLMAAVIYELWMGNDAGAMILPGSIPLDVPNVRDELTRHLSEGWNAIVDREVDGKNSTPYQTDQSTPRYGRNLAARRVARAIMLGSAPTDRTQAVRGIEASRIRLGVVQPGENIAVFNDALNILQGSLAYLYTNPSGDRFWYDTRPTLRKTAEDRATQISAADVEFEIERRLRLLRKEAPFAGIHVCPGSSLDVPDDRAARLVVLRPGDEYKASNPQNKGIQVAEEILNNHEASPRIYRNMLAFIAPDQGLISSLRQGARQYLAWRSIKDDSEALNLDAAQNRETDSNLRRSDETVELRIKETYSWLLVPYVDRSADMKVVKWNEVRISGGNDGIVVKAAQRMIRNEDLITNWAPKMLLMELDAVLWNDSDSIGIKKLWEQLCTYCYLPRLAGRDVLLEAIRKGVDREGNTGALFAYASEWDSDRARYKALTIDRPVGDISETGLLVKASVARKQIAETPHPLPPGTEGPGAGGTAGPADPKTAQPAAPLPPGMPANDLPCRQKFFLSTRLDNTRINKDVDLLNNEIIRHLEAVADAKVKITIEVHAETSPGTYFKNDIVRVVNENCDALHVENHSWE